MKNKSISEHASRSDNMSNKQSLSTFIKYPWLLGNWLALDFVFEEKLSAVSYFSLSG